jgi:peroxiredoxin-like protein
MEQEHSYQVKVNWQEKRMGQLTAPEIPLEITVATPPDFPQGIIGIWSPEHLFVAALASCLMTTFLAIAEKSKLDFVDFSCSAVGIVDKSDGSYKVTEVTLKPLVTLATLADREKAERVLALSEKNCLISNSVTAIVKLVPHIHVSL